MDTFLSLSASCTLISSLWTMTIAAIIAIIVLHINNSAIRILQLIVTATAWTYALHSISVMEEGDGWIAILVLFISGAFSAGMSTRYHIGNVNGIGGFLFLVAYFVFSCFIVWIVNVFAVLIASLTSLFQLRASKKIVAGIVLLLMILPILAHIATPFHQMDVIKTLVARPIYQSVINSRAETVVDTANRHLQYTNLPVPALDLIGLKQGLRYKVGAAITPNDVAALNGLTLDIGGADKPAFIVCPRVETDDTGVAHHITWEICDMNLHEDAYLVTIKNCDSDRNGQLRDGDVIVLTTPKGEPITSLSVSIHF